MKLHVVSNRLPVTFVDNDGKYELVKSSGGLVSGVSAYLASMNTSSLDNSNYYWTGWPGLTFTEKKQEEIKELLDTNKIIPVFLNEKVMDKFYYGFCNKTIWPLFHYFPTFTVYDNEMWEIYKQVNEEFCDIVCSNVKEDDTIWIHDYHLMLLPNLIRKRMKNVKIGFFLHIPFPQFEIYRLLPTKWREEILRGLLGADLIGFHTNDYTRYFLGSVSRILGYDNEMGEMHFEERIVKAETFPMGIDYKYFNDLANSENVVKEFNVLKQNYNNQKTILSIDRLDYSKGILNRLNGYQHFLENNPDWKEKVQMLAVTVPSRIGVDRYNHMKKEIEEIISKINGLYGTLHWIPIIYQFRSFDNEQLSALYKISDVALITPLRDGMNLISKEYLASRTDDTGVLILSEMAGASKEMIESIIINPNHIENISDAIKTALEMKKSEQIERNKVIKKRLKNNDVINWANNFIISLYSLKGKQSTFAKKHFDSEIQGKLIDAFKKANKKIVFLDYDGTLVPFFDEPLKAKPDSELLKLLTELTSNPSIELVIISGRDYETMDQWFWKLNANIVAEHGVWIKKKNRKWKIAKKMDNSWKVKIIPILKNYSKLLACSFYEEKSHSLVWHYRKADKIHGEMVANELTDNLNNVTGNMNLQVLRGNKIVEIRNIDINKGTAVKEFNPGVNYDFILSIGDDWTDEDMFQALPHDSFTIKVGMAKSYSKYNVNNYKDVRNIIKELINAK